MTEKLVRIGGLMRCCLATLGEYSGSDDNGTRIKCKYCSSHMIVRDDEWMWDQPGTLRDIRR